MTNGFNVNPSTKGIISIGTSRATFQSPHNAPRRSNPLKIWNDTNDNNVDGDNNQYHHHHDVKNDDSNRVVHSIHRRQILLSMLASAGVSSSAVSNVWADSDSSNVSLVVDEPSVANSLRGDGNKKLIIPPMDDRFYETMTLDNGLRVLLCSDLSSFSAAAAMDVHVGATSDPDTVPGLAHFCEVKLLCLYFDENIIVHHTSFFLYRIILIIHLECMHY